MVAFDGSAKRPNEGLTHPLEAETEDTPILDEEIFAAWVARKDRADVKVKFADKGAQKRRKFDIHAYVGLNGSGKTLSMIHDTWPSLRAGRKVLSTVRLIDPMTGKDHPQYERLTEWSQLFEAHSCDVLFDEVQGIANSRASQGMPVQVQTFLHQLRRRDIRLRWTSPSWSRADLLLREVTQAVTICRGYFPEPRHVAGERLAWGSNRLFRWLTYDAADFTEWTDSKEGNIRGLNNTWYWRGDKVAQYLYDTLDKVDRIGDVLDSGTCAHCGGHRARAKCSCETPFVEKRAQLGTPTHWVGERPTAGVSSQSTELGR